MVVTQRKIHNVALTQHQCAPLNYNTTNAEILNTAQSKTPAAVERPPFIRLVIYQLDTDTANKSLDLILTIPIATIEALCLKPVKFLCYLAWAIPDVRGFLSNEQFDQALEEQDKLTEGMTYYYNAIGKFPLAHQSSYQEP